MTTDNRKGETFKINDNSFAIVSTFNLVSEAEVAEKYKLVKDLCVNLKDSTNTPSFTKAVKAINETVALHLKDWSSFLQTSSQEAGLSSYSVQQTKETSLLEFVLGLDPEKKYSGLEEQQCRAQVEMLLKPDFERKEKRLSIETIKVNLDYEIGSALDTMRSLAEKGFVEKIPKIGFYSRLTDYVKRMSATVSMDATKDYLENLGFDLEAVAATQAHLVTEKNQQVKACFQDFFYEACTLGKFEVLDSAEPTDHQQWRIQDKLYRRHADDAPLRLVLKSLWQGSVKVSCSTNASSYTIAEVMNE